MKNVVILVDVQNIYYTTKQIHKCNFDYNAFWAQATKDRNVVKAIAYTSDRGDEKQQQFQNILRAIGFEVKLKPYIQRSDGSAKCDWDIGITIDAMDYAREADILVLATGDGDFEILVTKIQTDYKVPVEVYGVQQLTANALITAASKYIPIESKLLLRSSK
jgi:uncharacterized LabA/DUF88 family protein